MRSWFFILGTLGLLGCAAWVSDWVTLQGERTVYTVGCADGAWHETRCAGQLVAGDRYRFRALPAHGEVLFWTVGSKQPSGKFTDCSIQDGRNWLCKANADASRTITLQLTQGRPLHDETGKCGSFHAVSKWRWWLINCGVYAGDSADL